MLRIQKQAHSGWRVLVMAAQSQGLKGHVTALARTCRKVGQWNVFSSMMRLSISFLRIAIASIDKSNTPCNTNYLHICCFFYTKSFWWQLSSFSGHIHHQQTANAHKNRNVSQFISFLVFTIKKNQNVSKTCFIRMLRPWCLKMMRCWSALSWKERFKIWLSIETHIPSVRLAAVVAEKKRLHIWVVNTGNT